MIAVLLVAAVIIAIGAASMRLAYQPPVVTAAKRVPGWLVDAARTAEARDAA